MLKTTLDGLEATRKAWDKMEWGDAQCDASREDIEAVIHDAGEAHRMATLIDRLEMELKNIQLSNLMFVQMHRGPFPSNHETLAQAFAAVKEWREGK